MRVKILLSGPYIKIALASQNKGVGWLANKLGVSQSYMSDLMSGRRTASPKTRTMIVRILANHDWDKLFVIKGV